MDTLKNLATMAQLPRKFGQRMSNDSDCLNLNDELWYFRADYTTRIPTMAVFSLFYVVIIVCGCIGNTCVILAIMRNKTLQTVPNLFIVSLSCSDIVVCCISATITPITAFRKEWMFGAALCRIAPFIAGISLCFSTFTLTAISVDRYMLIRFPMKKPLSHTQAMFVIAFICVLAACISSPIMFKQKLGPFENFCGQYCTEDWSGKDHQRRIYGAALLGVQLIVPLIIIIISYTAISLRIGQSMILKGAKQQSSDNWEVQLTDQQRMAVKRKQRTNRMLIGMVVAFSLSWIWSVSFNVLRDYEYLPEWIKEQEYLFGIATHCVAMTSTVWNPLLYAMLNLQLRAAFIGLMPNWLRTRCGFDGEKGSPLINGTTGDHSRIPCHTKYGTTASQQPQQVKTLVAVQSRNGSGGCSAVSSVIGQPDRQATPSFDEGCRAASPLATPLFQESEGCRAASRASSRRSRKPSAIRVLVQKIRSGEEVEPDRELLLADSPETPPIFLGHAPINPPPRRKSTACVRVERTPRYEQQQTSNSSLMVRTSSF